MADTGVEEYRLLNIEQVADLLGISKASIYRARSEGNAHIYPPAIQVGTRIRWRLSTVLEWLEEQEGKQVA